MEFEEHEQPRSYVVHAGSDPRTRNPTTRDIPAIAKYPSRKYLYHTLEKHSPPSSETRHHDHHHHRHHPSTRTSTGVRPFLLATDIVPLTAPPQTSLIALPSVVFYCAWTESGVHTVGVTRIPVTIDDDLDQPLVDSSLTVGAIFLTTFPCPHPCRCQPQLYPSPALGHFAAIGFANLFNPALGGILPLFTFDPWHFPPGLPQKQRNPTS